MIKRLQVRNFLSLRKVELEPGRRWVLVGPNMSGKSNLIECLRFLTSIATGGLHKAFLDRDGFPEVIWKGVTGKGVAEDGRIGLALTIEVPADKTEEHKAYEYEILIAGSITGQFAVEKERLVFKRKNRTTTLVDFSNSQGKLFNQDGALIHQVSLSPTTSALEYNIPGWEGTYFKSLLSSWRSYRLIPRLMKQANPAQAQTFLNEYGDNFSSWLMTLRTGYPEEFGRIKQVAVDVLPNLDDILTPPTQMATTYVTSREKHLKRPISVWRMSDGEVAFLALLSLIFAPKELGAPLYCVEEPENHLHPRLIETLLEVHTQRLRELGEEAAQVIVTTHSPHLVDHVSLEELIVVEKKEGESQFLIPASKRHLKEHLERQDIGLGELWYSGALGKP